MGNERLDAIEHGLRARLLQGLGGDGPAYHAFLVELGRHLRAYFRRRLHHGQQEAEDLIQETLIAVHNQRHTYDHAQPVTAWIHAIARYKLFDVLRRRHRGGEREEPLEEAHELLAATDDEAAEATRDVARLLDQLPERQRLPIVHVKLEGRSVAETAALTGMSESAVKVAVHRGLKALAAKIREMSG